MAQHGYFNHMNFQHQHLGGRLAQEHISYILTGENIYKDVFNAIYMLHSFQNFEDHREVMLNPEYQYLGIDVAFNGEGLPYATKHKEIKMVAVRNRTL